VALYNLFQIVAEQMEAVSDLKRVVIIFPFRFLLVSVRIARDMSFALMGFVVISSCELALRFTPKRSLKFFSTITFALLETGMVHLVGDKYGQSWQ
jgi:hypothetical protein